MLRDAPSILVLAAGASARMRGEDKLLRSIDGTPLLLRAVRAACAASGRVVVVLPVASPRRALLDGTPATVVDVTAGDMSASIRAGVSACRPGAVMIHLADMPEIDADDLRTLVAAWRAGSAAILRAASADGRPGQPVTFDMTLRAGLLTLTGDAGARHILAGRAVETVRLAGDRALVDLDTPEAWMAWEAARRS